MARVGVWPTDDLERHRHVSVGSGGLCRHGGAWRDARGRLVGGGLLIADSSGGEKYPLALSKMESQFDCLGGLDVSSGMSLVAMKANVSRQIADDEATFLEWIHSRPKGRNGQLVTSALSDGR